MNVFIEFGITLAVSIAIAIVAMYWKPGFARRYTISPRTADTLFFLLASLYILVFGALSILRHESFHSGGFDLGIFDQNIWNSLHGRPFQNSIAIESPILLGQHLSFLLMAFVPLYTIWADACTLLIAQTLLLTLTAFPLYWFARKQIGYGLALVVSAVFFLFPSLQYVNLFEFHEVTLAMPLLSVALFFFLRQQYDRSLIGLLTALLVKEEIGLIVAAFGIYLFIKRKHTLGITLALLGVTWTIAALVYVIPSFRDPTHGTTYQYVDRYLYLGTSVPEIIQTVITQPGLVLGHLFVPSKIEFVLQLLIPLAFLPLAGVEITALALPTLGYLLLGDNSFQNSIHFQYTALLIPFIFFGLVIGIKRFATPRRIAPVATLLIVAGIGNYYFQSAGPLACQFNPTQYAITPRVQLGHQLLAQIPPNAVVMADSNFVPHISDRQFVYQTSVVPDLRQIDYLLADSTLPLYAEYKWIWDDVLVSPYFETLFAQDDYVFKKRASYQFAHALDTQFDQRISLMGYTIESNLPAHRGEITSLVLVWRANQDIHERYIIFLHLIDSSGKTWAQGDREPANGWFRTDRWNAGDVTPDRYELELPDEIPSGDYQILVGLYNVATGERLRTHAGNDNTILTSIQVQ